MKAVMTMIVSHLWNTLDIFLVFFCMFMLHPVLFPRCVSDSALCLNVQHVYKPCNFKNFHDFWVHMTHHHAALLFHDFVC